MVISKPSLGYSHLEKLAGQAREWSQDQSRSFAERLYYRKQALHLQRKIDFLKS